MTDTESEDISRRAQLRALVRVARYRPVFTAAIIGAGVFAAALEAVGLSFILPIVEIVQSPGDPAAEADGVLGVFVAAYRTLGIPFTLGSVVVGVSLVLTVRSKVFQYEKWLQASDNDMQDLLINYGRLYQNSSLYLGPLDVLLYQLDDRCTNNSQKSIGCVVQN